jgi:hypothetical protein
MSIAARVAMLISFLPHFLESMKDFFLTIRIFRTMDLIKRKENYAESTCEKCFKKS